MNRGFPHNVMLTLLITSSLFKVGTKTVTNLCVMENFHAMVRWFILHLQIAFVPEHEQIIEEKSKFLRRNNKNIMKSFLFTLSYAQYSQVFIRFLSISHC